LTVASSLSATPQSLQTQNTATPAAAGGGTTQGVFTLSVTGACPGPVTVDITGATPFSQVVVAWSVSTGSFTIPAGGCAGTTLGLGSPNVLTILVTDVLGSASLAANAPAAACGLYLQAVDLGNCTTGNIVQVGVVSSSFDFPSASSAIVGSVGFIDGEQAGYFWDNFRGDGASETVSGPASISSYSLDVDLPSNALNNGNVVNWDMVINGTVVDSFTVNVGDALISRSASFGSIAGPSYTLELRVTNQVPGGGGSCSLRYAGVGNHTITVQ